MSFEKIKIALEAGKFEPVYFFSGEESYYIDTLTALIEKHALTETQRDFNQHVFYGKDSEPQEVVNAARRYPAFSERQLVIVKEAQHFKNFDAFVPYLENPVASTVLVFNHKHKKLDKRTKFGKLVPKKSVYLETSRLREYQVPDWIVSFFKEHKRMINQKSALLLTDHLGNDLAKITNELNKLLLNVPEGTEINADHIEEYIGISKDFNAFELSNAIASKNYLKAIQIIKYFEKNPKAGPLIFVLSIVFNYFTKVYQLHHAKGMSDSDAMRSIGVNAYFFKDYKQGAANYSLPKTEYILMEIALTDAKAKGVGQTNNIGDYELLKELVFKIMH